MQPDFDDGICPTIDDIKGMIEALVLAPNTIAKMERKALYDTLGHETTSDCGEKR